MFGDGQRLVAIALDYGRPLRAEGLSAAAFKAPGRTITAVYASETPSPGRPGGGRYVIVELSADDPEARLREGGPGGRSGLPNDGSRPPRDKSEDVQGQGVDPGAMHGPPPGMANPKFRPASATIAQVAPLMAADGRRFTPSATPIVTTRVNNLIVDNFRQLEFRDRRTGDTLKYNLFVPEDYDPKRSYPLVLFMHDAGATSNDPLTTLRQGLGAVVWASPEDQAKRPCFVLAPQYASPTVDDQSHANSLLDTTVNLVNVIATQYSIDRRRLYATGQSGGAMMSIAMNISIPSCSPPPTSWRANGTRP